MKKMEITFLGTGTSTGIPMIGCHCPTCTSTNKKNNRLRTSIFINYKNHYHFVIDTGPDLRTQLLRENINKCDFAIITHDHSDHLHGIDDLRPFTFFPKRHSLPVFCHQTHHRKIENKFDYIFKRDQVFNAKNPYLGGGLPLLNLHLVEEISNFFPEILIEPMMLPHGSGQTMGLLLDNRVAYLIDCHEVPSSHLKRLKEQQLECLIIDCLQLEAHPSHLTVDKCFDYIEEISPKQAFLIHMNHDLEHEALQDMATNRFSIPVTVAYDQLKIKV